MECQPEACLEDMDAHIMLSHAEPASVFMALNVVCAAFQPP